MNRSKYLFQSERLGFRNWTKADEYDMIQINLSEQVMEFFPNVQNEFATIAFIQRMQAHFQENGYCYFAVDILDSKEFIGFIGLCNQNFEAEFTPCIDIGWRLAEHAWNKGYATEGAKKCLEYAFENLSIEEVYAIAPVLNKKSIAVMKKLGMEEGNTFIHPAIKNDDRLSTCIYYTIKNSSSKEKVFKLDNNPFDYKVTKDDKVIIYRGNEQIMILKGSKASDFIINSSSKTPNEIQLILAKITGHYKHGNER